jgi:hypothetical protein
MSRRNVSPAAAAVFLLFAVVVTARAQKAVQTFALTGVQDLVGLKVKVEPVEYKGRKAVRVTKETEGEGLAMLRNTQFEDGTIEADVAVKLTTPAGVRNPGFIGIAFRSRPDALHYDGFYLRPGNSIAEDQAMRNHSVQYFAPPDFDWYKLRRSWPWVYEAHADLQLETWTRIKIEVSGRRARLYVNGAASPALVVDGLKGEDLKGGVGLWGSDGQESYFSNLRISHVPRQPIENTGEAAGAWELKYSSDAGNFACLMKLQRDGRTLSGTVSGLLGSDLPVAGTWRNGYVELSFRGTWHDRDPGEATASLAGWIDGDSAKGRLIVNGRADGVWSATRKQ